MDKPEIKNHEILRYQIGLLQSREKELRGLILSDVSSVVQAVKEPAPMIKRLVKSLAGDSDFRSDLLKIVINFATGYVQNKFGAAAAGGNILLTIIEKLRQAAGRTKK